MRDTGGGGRGGRSWGGEVGGEVGDLESRCGS